MEKADFSHETGCDVLWTLTLCTFRLRESVKMMVIDCLIGGPAPNSTSPVDQALTPDTRDRVVQHVLTTPFPDDFLHSPLHTPRAVEPRNSRGGEGCLRWIQIEVVDAQATQGGGR